MTTSPDGTSISVPMDASGKVLDGGAPGQLIDANGAVWTFGAAFVDIGPFIYGYRILKNGVWYAHAAVATKIAMYGGVLWCQSTMYTPPHWFKDNGTTMVYSPTPPANTTTPPITTIPPTITPTGSTPPMATGTIDPNTLTQLQGLLSQYQVLTAQFASILTSQSGGGTSSATPSPSGTTITGPTSDTLTDGKLAVWSLGFPAPYGCFILKNGVQYAGGSGAKLTIDKNGVIWTFNNVGMWYMDNGTGWSQQAAGPSL